MIITCPNCSTKYNLAEDKLKANSKLRCTVCKHIFSLSTEEAAVETKEALDFAGTLDSFDAPAPHLTKKKSKLIPIILICAIGLGAAFYAVYTYTSLLDFLKTAKTTEQATSALAEKAETKLIHLKGVRQYNITNEKVGKLSVIEGKAVNGYDVPKELIRVEAVLYDKDRNVLVAKQQLAGTTLSLFQLQVLAEQEMDQAIGNKIDILANNTNVAPGAEVPFMIVFFNPAQEASEFGVRVIDARDSAKK